MKLIDIPEALLSASFEHGIKAYPEEGCGVLSGPADTDTVDTFHPIENVLNRLHEEDPESYPRTAADGYVLDPQAMHKLERELAANKRKIKVIVHSHVDVGAYFSQEDKDRATWAGEPLLPGIVYLVCGVKENKPDGAILAYFDATSRTFETQRLTD